MKLKNKVYSAVRMCMISIMLFSTLSFLNAENLGAGSYVSTGYQNPTGLLKTPAGFNQPVQTNDWWSSLIWNFNVYGDQPHSQPMFPHPLAFQAQSGGLDVQYPTYYTVGGEYKYPYGAVDLTIGVSGMSTESTKPVSYSDWIVTAGWDNMMEATIGHGLPFVYVNKISSSNATVTFPTGSPAIWYNQGGVIGVTVNGHNYGIFGPSGSSWSGSNVLQSNLNGKNYFSVAALPDASGATLEFYRQHAYSFITDTKVSWNYDEALAQVTSTFTATVSQKENGGGIVNRPLMALYRHQWLNSSDVNTSYSYVSPRGEMKVVSGTSFSTQMAFSGILPSLPDAGTYDRGQLYNYVNEVYQIADLWSLSESDTYWQGKIMAMIAHLVPIAEQVGHTAARDRFLTELKNKLEDWFTAGGSEFFYNPAWNYLVGFPASFNSEGELNDHDFHWGYFVMASAIIAQYDPAWASDSRWGSMVQLLIKDVANMDRNDTMFPFLRSFDVYAGHDWANGPALFAAGNNEESSSEAINFATGVILFGINTGNDELRDLGIFMYSNMVQAIGQYWFDVDNQTYPPEFEYPGVGIVWGDGGAHATWFGGTPEFIYGINFLPLTGGSLYLGHRPDYVNDLYDRIVSENGGQENDWVDIIWNYQAMANPQAALAKFGSGNYEVFTGESKAHTYHWLHNFNALGTVDASVSADIPTYAVFIKNGNRTYVAYNPDSTGRNVRFSDGVTLFVPARSTTYGDGSSEDPYLNVSPGTLTTGSGFYKTGTPVTITFTGSGFEQWNGDVKYLADRFSASTTLTMPGNDVNITAQYSGGGQDIPGRIEAESFDAFYDTTGSVGTEDCSEGGLNVGWIQKSEWLEYDVNIKETGSYDLSVRVAAQTNAGALRVLINGVDVSGPITFNATGDWQNWTTVTVNDISLTAGSGKMRIAFESSDMNINYVEFTGKNPKPTVSITNPANGAQLTAGRQVRIEADADDLNGQVSKVDFYVRTTGSGSGLALIGSDTSAPYQADWIAYEGNLDIVAIATDNEGAESDESVINVTVEKQGTWLPYEDNNGTVTVNPSAVSANVILHFPNMGFRVTDWGTVIISGNRISVDAKVDRWTGESASTPMDLDTSYTLGQLAEGEYTFTFTTWDKVIKTVSFTIGGSGKPIEGRIEAEDFDSFYDTSGLPGTESCSEGGLNVGWIEPGEWLEYDVYVQETGTYDVSVQVAAQTNSGALRILMDGTDVTGLITFNPTGSWQGWTTVTVNNVNLSAGSRKMRIVFESAGMNINYADFVLKAENEPKGFEFTGTLPNGLVDGQMVNYKTTAAFDGSVVTITFESSANLHSIYLHTPGFNSMTKDGSVWKSELSGYSEGNVLTWYYVAIGSGSQADNVSAQHTWTVAKGGIVVNNPPEIFLTAPANGTQYYPGDTVNITAEADDSDGYVTGVEFFVNGTSIGTQTSPAAGKSYKLNWTAPAAGSYTISAVAADDKGLTSNSQVIISVNGINELKLTVDKTVIQPNGSDRVTMSVNKTGPAVYYANGQQLAGYTFSTYTAGVHTLYAVVNGEKSNEVTVIAQTGGNTLPYVFENNSRYADDEIFIALVGQIEGQGSVWLDMAASTIKPINESYNTIKAPDYTGADQWLYADVFTKLSDIPGKTIQIPKIYGCRIFVAFKEQIYLHFFADGGYAAPNLENEMDPNRGIRFELVELTWAENGLWTNTTRVDSYQYPMGLEVWGENNTYKKVGEIKTHQEIINAWQSRVPSEFLPCYKTDYYEPEGIIMQPSKISEFDEGGVSEHYFKAYIDAVWEKYKTDELVTWLGDRGEWRGRVEGESLILTGPDGTKAAIEARPSTQDAIEGKGQFAKDVTWTPDIHADLMIQAQFCAAINRGVIDLSAPSGTRQDWSIETNYFAPGKRFNEYVKFWHSEDISYESETYAFCYDDVFDHSSTIQNPNPTAVKVTIGGFAGK